MRFCLSPRLFSLRAAGMRDSRQLLFRRLSAGMMVMALTVPSAIAQHLATNVVTVHAQRMIRQLNAYAQVRTTSTLPLNASEPGVVAGLSVEAGMHVRAGEVLARLRGPEIRAVLLQDKANLRSAKTQLIDAKKSLNILKEQLRAHLSTRDMVHRAESAVAKAQSAVENAQAQVDDVQRARTITAPTNGVVLARNSHNGELLQTGDPVVTLQSANSLWLVATYYGRELRAIHAGMTGRFKPSDGSTAIPVEVVSLFAAATPGGGESVALRPLHGRAAWINGETGAVTLRGPSRMLPVVPTRALVLSHGKWWVMVHTAKGDRPQQVVPGRAKGWETFIKRGLKPGAQVVATNAYLLFNSKIAQHYEIPD